MFTACVVAAFLIAAASACVFELSRPAYQASYFVWRLHKPNATDADRYRARTKLGQFLATDPTIYPQLTGLLTTPNLPVKTAEEILSLLVETRDRAENQNQRLRSLLVDSLRSDNSDIRERIQKTLLYLAADRNLAVPPELQNWNSDPKNTAADIDTIIKKWRQVG